MEGAHHTWRETGGKKKLLTAGGEDYAGEALFWCERNYGPAEAAGWDYITAQMKIMQAIKKF